LIGACLIFGIDFIGPSVSVFVDRFCVMIGVDWYWMTERGFFFLFIGSFWLINGQLSTYYKSRIFLAICVFYMRIFARSLYYKKPLQHLCWNMTNIGGTSRGCDGVDATSIFSRITKRCGRWSAAQTVDHGDDDCEKAIRGCDESGGLSWL